MSKKSAILYFDETGFTGNDLLDKHQQYFCYAGLESYHDEAEVYVKYIIDKYNIQSSELKGRLLLKNKKGKRAILEIITYFKNRFKFAFADKEYVLAGKIFEYCLEPLISNKSILFYERNFHRIISHVIYVSFKAQKSSAIEIYESFVDFIRNNSPLNIEPEEQSFMGDILEFIELNIEFIRDEVRNSIPADSRKWLLDLTQTSLFTLLESFNKEYEELIVFCDCSKPLKDAKSFFNDMVGEKNKIYTQMGALEPYSLLLNMKEPIHFVNSEDVYGIQLADAIAAGCNYACNPNNKDEFAESVKEIILADNMCIAPVIAESFLYSELSDPNVQMNLFLLKELVRRSKEGEDLLADIENYIFVLDRALQESPLQDFIK